jgi:hypothetical protein
MFCSIAFKYKLGNLWKEEFKQGQQIFDARIIERESTMHETEQLALMTTCIKGKLLRKKTV